MTTLFPATSPHVARPACKHAPKGLKQRRFASRFRAARRRGFTLVELLVVIGIMGALLALIMPAFTGLGRGASMRSGVMQLRSTLALARQWAITHRERTYVLFPDETLSYSGGDARMARRAYGVWGEQSGYIAEWRYLPQGIVFDPGATAPGAVNLTTAKDVASGQTTVYPFRFPATNSSPQNIFSIGFKGNGRPTNTEFYMFAVFLSEGWTDVDTNINVATLSVKSNSTYSVRLEMNHFTGQIKVREM